jgi:hypothetical protein
MRYVDYALAWTLLLTAVVFILIMETTHPPGAILDVPFLWLIIAMMNFLRLRNSGAATTGLKTSCIGANLVGSVLEIVRFRLFGTHLWHDWGPYTAIAGIAIVGELLLSVAKRNDSSSAAQV